MSLKRSKKLLVIIKNEDSNHKTMTKNTFQEKKWAGKFGRDYTFRNPLSIREMDKLYLRNHGISRTKLDKDFLGRLNRSIKILEVGCNAGVQLLFLQKMGFKNLCGIEINRETLEFSKSIINNVNLIKGSALDIPFKDNYFDLVFTSGVLIHISPSDIKRAMEEIYRCTKKYIWGFECYYDDYIEITYRGNQNLHWKGDFAKMYLDNFKDLKLVKERKLKYLKNENIDTMFLLKKNGRK